MPKLPRAWTLSPDKAHRAVEIIIAALLGAALGGAFVAYMFYMGNQVTGRGEMLCAEERLIDCLDSGVAPDQCQEAIEYACVK